MPDRSGEESEYEYEYYQKWMQYGPTEYTPIEYHMLDMFAEWFDYEETQESTLMSSLRENLQIGLAAGI